MHAYPSEKFKMADNSVPAVLNQNISRIKQDMRKL